MSRDKAIGVLTGADAGLAFGVSWVPPAAARQFLGASGAPDSAREIAEVASVFDVDLAFVSADEEWAVAAAAELRKRDIAVAWAVAGPLGRVAERLGWATLLRRSARDAGELAGLLADALHDVTDLVRQGSDAGADVIVLADDVASGSGWLVSPDFALSAVIPCAEHVVRVAHGCGIPVVFHSDGDVRALFGALREAGVSGVHVGSLSGDAFLAVAMSARKRGLATLGGLSVRAVLGEGPAGAVAGLTDSVFGGRIVVCDDGGMTTAEELTALGEAFDEVRDTLEG